MNVSHGAALRGPLAVAVLTAGLMVAGCGTNASNAPATSPAPPSGPAVTSAPPAQPLPAARAWTTSVCQTVTSTLAQLGAPPQANTSNPTATRQAYADYLSRASNAVQQAMDRLASIGAPPVANGQQIFDQLRTQLTQLRNNLNDAVTQLKAANPNDAAAIGPAFGAAGNVVSLLGTLISNSNSELRAAIDQTPECHNIPGMGAATTTTAPSQPPPT
jgi:hypothetical protein